VAVINGFVARRVVRGMSKSRKEKMDIRSTVDGHEFDLQSWLRFFDLLEKRDNVWRIVKRTAVYEKDRLEPVDPRGVPKEVFDDMELSDFQYQPSFYTIGSAAVVVRLRLTLSLPTVTRNVH
jgi:hypothetical protein